MFELISYLRSCGGSATLFPISGNSPLQERADSDIIVEDLHIVQDLVINRARVDRTSYAFRKTLGAADRKITIADLEGEPEIVTVGDYVLAQCLRSLCARPPLDDEMSGAALEQFLKVH